MVYARSVTRTPADSRAATSTVVWFASPFFAEPLADFVEKSLKDLPWEQQARDFEF